MRTVHPRPLSFGSRIAVTCPASPVAPLRLERGIARLRKLGYDVVQGASCRAEGHLWAGEDRARADELRAFLCDPSIDAIIAGRGGVGCLRILPLLEELPADLPPTWIIGRSDLTAIHLAFWGSRRWIGLSGPMVATDFGGEDPPPPTVVEAAEAILRGSAVTGPVVSSPLDAWRAGEAEGVLIPANLSLLTSLVGTGYLPSLAGTILVLEEIGEPPRRCDRMLTQLRLSGALDGLAGLVFGQFTGCREEGAGFADDLIWAVLRDHAETIGLPTLAGLPYGHEREFRPLPVGTRATIRRDPPSLIVLEGAAAGLQEEQP
jgi:muramoyltetrapeptide carboxypeptidase